MTGAAPDPGWDALDPRVRTQILRYRYRLPVHADDLAHLADVRPTVRRWAAAGRPNSVMAARRMMRIATGFALHARRTAGVNDLDGALTPDLAAQWIREETTHSSGWLRRSGWLALARIGRAVNPDAWPPGDDGGGLPSDDREERL